VNRLRWNRVRRRSERNETRTRVLYDASNGSCAPGRGPITTDKGDRRRLSAVEREGWRNPIRSDRTPKDVLRPWLIRRLERAEQAVPHHGADAEVHDLSMVMDVVESLKSSQNR
jgi:hypothetical protein